MISTVKTGIYFGYAQVHLECPKGTASQLPDEDLQVWPMVMSIGWNPFYKNEKLTAVGASTYIQYRLDDCCPSRKST
jgi:riboflavin kinase